ncbi:MAG: selenide, water dikinase SelD [Gaiellaceae bacterium]
MSEAPVSRVETVRLTEYTDCGGCAAKYSAARLEQLLAGLAPPSAVDLLVGLAPADDAAVYRLDDERALVLTVDFFPPIVDDPGDFGAIAATNALSDVFAMGGTPLVAASIAVFPEELPAEAVSAVLASAATTVAEAGAVLAGGHTLRDAEPKYGLAVVGTVRPDALWTKAGARPGDALYVTKPLGTGLVVHGAKRSLADSEALSEAVGWMRMLSRSAADALRPLEPGAVTDVTGFGLLGHAWEIASRSGVRVVLESGRLPALSAALDVAGAGERTGGDSRNRDFAGPHVEVGGVSEELVALAYDPQTAGGLLVSLPEARAEQLERAFGKRGLFLRRIGSVEPGSGVLLRPS